MPSTDTILNFPPILILCICFLACLLLYFQKTNHTSQGLNLLSGALTVKIVENYRPLVALHVVMVLQIVYHEMLIT